MQACRYVRVNNKLPCRVQRVPMCCDPMLWLATTWPRMVISTTDVSNFAAKLQGSLDESRLQTLTTRFGFMTANFGSLTGEFGSVTAKRRTE